jgi:hypothetical protein
MENAIKIKMIKIISEMKIWNTNISEIHKWIKMYKKVKKVQILHII